MNDHNMMVTDISAIITETAITTLEKQNIKYSNSEEYIINFLNFTNDELKAVVDFIAEALPQYIYLNKHEDVRDHAVFLISKELITFLVQEDKKSSEFQNNIKNLRNEIIAELLNNVYVKNM
jgi:hypothetical protein